jgi:hypothetical protein
VCSRRPYSLAALGKLGLCFLEQVGIVALEESRTHKRHSLDGTIIKEAEHFDQIGAVVTQRRKLHGLARAKLADDGGDHIHQIESAAKQANEVLALGRHHLDNALGFMKLHCAPALALGDDGRGYTGHTLGLGASAER